MRVPINTREPKSPLLDQEKPSPENLLMAAATMHQLGRLTNPEGTPRPLKLTTEKRVGRSRR